MSKSQYNGKTHRGGGNEVHAPARRLSTRPQPSRSVSTPTQTSIAKFVPILTPPSITGPVRKFEEIIHASLELEEAARRNCTLQDNGDKLYSKWQFLRRQTDRLVKQISTMSYRDFVESSTKAMAGTYGLARVGAIK
ncbi:zinc knuckle [Colletotrichum scovillei]|uniref:Zinc knuckle n=1 Tax=Colletotrichum scovillei TaxID=1209932 RepID=A0A9P7UH17_9PEZI|nr:zinc knuckle [Colletotrichum scovillei]KAG7075538.1 zinc knuckle [Colletotrichum scovillei]KAG7082688.1 zinc knuckle [Colletotrichum scovillei]